MTQPTGGADRRWSSSSLLWLAYLGFLLPGPLFDPAAGALAWTVTVAAVVVFVPLYVATDIGAGRWSGHWPPLLSTALGLVVIPFNAGAAIFLVYAAAFAGMSLPRRTAVRWVIGLAALIGVCATLSAVPLPYRLLTFGPSFVFVWIVGAVAMGEADRDRDTVALRMENARIEHLSTLTERERIARDLHDLLGQTLTGIVVRAQLAQRLGGPDAVTEMAAVENMARDALAEVRATVTGWRQLALDDELVVARDALAAAGVALSVVREPDLVLAPTVENALALALREAVTNVVRHAHAAHCTVALRSVDGRVMLEVADDGVGGGLREGNGLTGMRERIAALGGTVGRTARDGTTLQVALPTAVSV